MLSGKTTLTQFIIEEQRRFPGVSGDFSGLLADIGTACKAISASVRQGALAGILGSAGSENVQDEEQKKLDVIANETMLRSCEWGGHLAGMASEEMVEIQPTPTCYPHGKYLLLFDPLDGSSNIDVNVSVGTIFSILRAPSNQETVEVKDFLQPGVRQVCAGYAIYGPSTMLVLTTGNGVNGFTLDNALGEFILTHPGLRIPEETAEFAINMSNERFWFPAVTRYVSECRAGKTGPRRRDFNMRWIASAVAELHRILTRGGIFLYPRDQKDLSKAGRLRLLYEANPIAMIVEQAGGEATDGEHRILETVPQSLHQRIGIVFGSKKEVQLVSAYHREAHEAVKGS